MANNIVYRITNTTTHAAESIKGSGLTSTEVDANFKGISNELALRSPIDNPTFTGSVTIPAGTINNTSIGATTRSTGAFTTLTSNSTTTLTANTTSTSTTTGTLVVTGGVGVSGALYIGSTLNVTGLVTLNGGGVINNTSIGATTRSTGAFTTLTANSATTLTANTTSTSTTTGTLVVTGGVGVSGALYIGSTLNVTGNVTLLGGTINGTSIGATTRSTGAFTTLTANSATTLTANTTSTSTTTGTLVVTGGVGVSGNLNVGGQPDFSTHTGALKLPSGTTAQRPGTPINGMVRFNSTTQSFEGYTNTLWGPLSQTTNYYTFENRNELRGLSPLNYQTAIVDEIGLFVWISGATDLDDDETVFATTSGRWIFKATSWDYVSNQLSSLPIPTNKIINGSFENTVNSLAASGQISYIISVPGAKVGTAVCVSPSDVLPYMISVHGFVKTPNTVSVYINNASGTTGTLPLGNWTFAVI